MERSAGSGTTPASDPEENNQWQYKKYFKYGAGIAIGSAATLAAVPVALSLTGFGATGIAAGSAGAKLMSIAATTGYGGSLVATAQSVGAAGMAWSTTIGLSSVGAYFGKKVADQTDNSKL